MIRIGILDKHIDSPNILHYSYGFCRGGVLCIHSEGSQFEGAPWEMMANINESYPKENSKWRVINSGAFFTIDSYNEPYDVSKCY